MESLKSVAAVFNIDFRELLLKQEQEPAPEPKATRSSFWVEFQRIWFKNKVVFWVMNLSLAFLTGLLFSVFISDDKEKLMLIITCMVTEVILWSIWGGYPAVRKRFIQKYGNPYSQPHYGLFPEREDWHRTG